MEYIALVVTFYTVWAWVTLLRKKKFRIKKVVYPDGRIVYQPEYLLIPFVWDGNEINRNTYCGSYEEAMNDIRGYVAKINAPKEVVTHEPVNSKDI